MSAVKSTIPDNIREEYYQINPDILLSFPKYRPPIDLFHFKESIATLAQLSRKGQRLSNEQVETAQALCHDGNLFVSRADYPVYSKHIIKQLDLVLVDKNLKEGEVADIFMRALEVRLQDFFDQPVKLVFDRLYTDLMVLTEYLSEDPFRIKSLARRLFREHTLARHSVNSGVLGLWLQAKVRGDDTFNRRELDRMALGLFLHDLGMCKIPAFILSKTKQLTMEERQKIQTHVLVGSTLVQKLGVSCTEISQCIMEHHERLDTSGYPRRVAQGEISRNGRLCAVVDSFCAMISTRPYAKAMEPMEAAQRLSQDSRRYDERICKLLVSGLATGELTFITGYKD